MNQTTSNTRFAVLTGIVFMAAMSRLMPHPANFTPIGAIALFGAAYYRRWIFAFLIPFLGLWISDLVLNNIFLKDMYSSFVWFGNAWVYIAFALIVVIGGLTLKKWTTGKLVGVTVLSSLLFFVLVNFGHWMGPWSLHTKTFAGLLATYVDAIPFDARTLMGNLVYTGIMFGTFEWMKKRYPKLSMQTA